MRWDISLLLFAVDMIVYLENKRQATKLFDSKRFQ